MALVGCSGKGGSGSGGKLIKALGSGDANAVQALLAEGTVDLSSLFSKASSGGDFSYELAKYVDGQGIRITKYTGKGGVVIVPKEIEGYPVKAIDGNSFYKTYINHNQRQIQGNDSIITAVILPDTIQFIGVNAFRDRNDMHTINLPSNLRLIATDPFKGCTELYNLIIPVDLSSLSAYNLSHEFRDSKKLPLITRNRLEEETHPASVKWFETDDSGSGKFYEQSRGE